MARAARHLAEPGEYATSRPPGFPVHEIACAAVWHLGPIASNTLTVVFSLVAAILFTEVTRSLGLPVRRSLLAGIALACVPVIYVNSTVTLDYVWALAFLQGGLLAACAGRPAWAGVCLGLAVGCRITSGAMLAPLLLILLRHGSAVWQWRRGLVFASVAVTISALAYLPVYGTYGASFFRFSDVDLGAMEIGRLLLYGSTLGVWGALGAAGVDLAAVTVVLAPGRSARNAILPAGKNVWVVAASILGIGLYTTAFVRRPVEFAYFIPAVPFVLLLILHVAHRTVATLAMVLVMASPFLIDVDTSLEARMWGPVFTDAARRKEQMHYLARACEDVQERTPHPVVLIAESEIEKFTAIPPRLLPSAEHDRDWIDAFRETRLVVPGYEHEKEAGTSSIPAAVVFEGRICLPAFDTVERLKAYVTDETTHVRVPGSALLGGADPGSGHRRQP